jgi:type VI secretion system secreted protein VgrG
MSLLASEKFSFISFAANKKEYEDYTFSVIHFTGHESLSQLYEFDISLVSDNADINLDVVLNYSAQLIIHREEGGDVYYNGVLRQFEQQREYQGYVFYRAVLVPRLWRLTLTRHNRVYLNESVHEFVEKTLKDGMLATDDYEFKPDECGKLFITDASQVKEVKPEYICQYGESHFNFISRWMEREGIYYYFEQGTERDKLIITNTVISHPFLSKERYLYYSPPSGLDSSHRGEVIQSFSCRQQPMPRKVILRDYNYEKPSLEVLGEADVDTGGWGEVNIYGDHFSTQEEGTRLAAIRAEEILCHKQEFFGESTVPYMMPGFMFTLKEHYRESFNRNYLIEEVTHEGNQTGFLISGLGEAITDRERTVYYRNSFKAIPSNVQYRPERTAEKPRMPGTLHARVETDILVTDPATNTSKESTAVLIDEQGRYKVRLPFDTGATHGAGKASHPIRMAQPYSGESYGVHFPLIRERKCFSPLSTATRTVRSSPGQSRIRRKRAR